MDCQRQEPGAEGGEGVRVLQGQPAEDLGAADHLPMEKFNEPFESDDHAEHLEDDDAGDVGVPDDLRLAVPDVQLMQALPL